MAAVYPMSTPSPQPSTHVSLGRAHLLTDWAARLRVRLREVRLSSRPPEHGEIEGEIASRSVVRKSHAKEAARSPRIHW